MQINISKIKSNPIGIGVFCLPRAVTKLYNLESLKNNCSSLYEY